jgi:hypothetical protein
MSLGRAPCWPVPAARAAWDSEGFAGPDAGSSGEVLAGINGMTTNGSRSVAAAWRRFGQVRPGACGAEVATRSGIDRIATFLPRPIAGWRSGCKRCLAVVQLLVVLGICSPVGATPVSFSTYLGGEHYDDAFGVAVDASGNIYVTGGTRSPHAFPVLDALQPEYGGGSAGAYLTSFDPEGRPRFSTHFGGESYDYGNAIAIDRDGNIIIVGETHSTELPTTEDAYQPFYAGGTVFGSGDGFIARFSPDGAQLLDCTYFGGSGDETIWSVAVDADGNIVIAGWTDSLDLPLRNPLQPVFGGGRSDGFIAKFDPTLRNLIFSTYFGGAARDEDLRVAVDPAGFIYVCGQTRSTDFPVTPGAFQTSQVVHPDIGPNWDAFVAKLTPDGSELVYSTYIGNATYDAAFAIAADADGHAYVTGAISARWPQGTFPLGFQPTPGGGRMDAFVAKLKPDGSNFEWFSYLGGDRDDVGYGLALDPEGHVVIVGTTESRNFPVRHAAQPVSGGGRNDAFIVRIRPDGQELVLSTFLGGAGHDEGVGVAVGPQGDVVVVGYTYSTNFPVHEAWQNENASGLSSDNPADAFVTKLNAMPEPPLTIMQSGEALLICWPSHFTGFGLESARTGTEPLSWQPVVARPLVVAHHFVVVQDAVDPTPLYRLVPQPGPAAPIPGRVALSSNYRIWGMEFFDPRGQSHEPEGLTDVVAVDAGITHALVLRTDGTVAAWSTTHYRIAEFEERTYGQFTVPNDLNDVIAISAGGVHNLALKSDGTVVAWGAGGPGESDLFHEGQSIVPNGLEDVIAISAGTYHSLALRRDGTVVAWGAGESGKSGQFDFGQSIVPGELDDAIAIAAGWGHSLALQSDGTVVAWGRNEHGEGTPPHGLTDAIAIAAGTRHSTALRADGTVVVWGGNDWGQADVPEGLTGVVAIASGYDHNLALKGDGTILAWGAGQTRDSADEVPSAGSREWGQSIMPDGLRGVVAFGGGSHVSLAVVAPLVEAHGFSGHLLLAWPSWARDRVGEWTDDLTAAESWAEETSVPVRLGESWIVTMRIAAGNRYYRLRK